MNLYVSRRGLLIAVALSSVLASACLAPSASIGESGQGGASSSTGGGATGGGATGGSSSNGAGGPGVGGSGVGGSVGGGTGVALLDAAWVKTIGGTGAQQLQTTALDPASSTLVVADNFSGAVSYEGVAAQGPAALLTAFDTATGAPTWTKTSRVPSTSGNAYLFGLDVNDVGVGVAVGEFDGTLDFGGTTITSPSDVFVGFVHTFDASTGAPTWTKKFGPALYFRATAVDETGRVFLSATVTKDSTFDGVTKVAPALAMEGLMMLSLDADGEVATYDVMGGAQTQGLTPSAEALDATADGTRVVVGGTFQGTLPTCTGSLTSVRGLDVFLAAYDDGACAWVIGWGADNFSDDISSVAVDDATGDILVAGTSTQGFLLGSQIVSAGPEAFVYVARFASDGAVKWATAIPNAGSTIRAVFDGDDVLAYGSWQGSVTIGTIAFEAPLYTPVLVRLDSDGNVTSVARFGASSGHIYATSMRTDGVGLFLTGGFSAESTFGSTTTPLTGNLDAFIARAIVQ